MPKAGHLQQSDLQRCPAPQQAPQRFRQYPSLSITAGCADPQGGPLTNLESFLKLSQLTRKEDGLASSSGSHGFLTSQRAFRSVGHSYSQLWFSPSTYMVVAQNHLSQGL